MLTHQQQSQLFDLESDTILRICEIAGVDAINLQLSTAVYAAIEQAVRGAMQDNVRIVYEPRLAVERYPMVKGRSFFQQLLDGTLDLTAVSEDDLIYLNRELDECGFSVQQERSAYPDRYLTRLFDAMMDASQALIEEMDRRSSAAERAKV